MIVLHIVFLTCTLCATRGYPRRLRGPLDAPNMSLGHFVLVRDCVWSSGDALVGLGDRAAACSRSTRGGSEGRAQVLRAIYGQIRSGKLPDLLPGWSTALRSLRLEVEQAAKTASQRRESTAC